MVLIAGQAVLHGRVPDVAGRVRPFQCLAQGRLVASGVAQRIARKRRPPRLLQRPTRRPPHARQERGGTVGYQARKKARTTTALFLADNLRQPASGQLPRQPLAQ